MKSIVLLLTLGILLHSAYAVDLMNSGMDHEDHSRDSSEVHSTRLSVLVNTAMELMQPEAGDTEANDKVTAQASN